MRNRNEKTVVATIEKLGVLIAITSGVLTCALVGGLPGFKCYAMVKTYGYAISMFGLTFVFAATGTAVAPTIRDVFHQRPQPEGRTEERVKKPAVPYRRMLWLWDASATILIVLSLLLFASGTLTSVDNLRRSAAYCYVGSTLDLAHRAHTPITLSQFPWQTFKRGIARWP